jgi:hypothetical protein
MTPRQLMALCRSHEEYQTPSTRGERHERTPARVNGSGSAGWLMAVSNGLDRNRKRRAHTQAAPTLSVPGVG